MLGWNFLFVKLIVEFHLERVSYLSLYFIGVNRSSKRGKKLRPFVYDTSERNEKVQSVVGKYELSQPILNLLIQNAKLKAITTSAYQRVRDVSYQLDLDCICTEVTGVIDQDLHEEVVYAKRSDETVKREFNERVQAENYMATVLYTKDESLPLRISAKLNSEQVIALFRSGAHRRDDFDDLFTQSFKDKALRLVSNEALPAQFILTDPDVFNNEQLGQVFSGVSLNQFKRGQYVLSESEKADFQMYVQSDFAQVFAQQLKSTCLALGEDVSFIDTLLPTDSEISQAQEAIDRELGGKDVTFIDDNPSLAVLQREDDHVVVNKPTIDLEDIDLAEAFGQDDEDYDLAYAMDTDDLDLSVDLDDTSSLSLNNDEDEEDMDMFSDDDLSAYFADASDYAEDESDTKEEVDDGLEL